MVDTHVSGACRAICGGSSPPIDIYFTLFTLTDKGLSQLANLSLQSKFAKLYQEF